MIVGKQGQGVYRLMVIELLVVSLPVDSRLVAAA